MGRFALSKKFFASSAELRKNSKRSPCKLLVPVLLTVPSKSAIALGVARHLVVFLKRPGGQSQFSAMLQSQARDDGGFAELHDWMAHHLAEDLNVDALARRTGMSPRNFARVYARRMGATPAKAVELLRIEAARRALEETAAPIETIARRCGFGDEERMRRSFLRRLGVPPRQYRSRFSRAAEATRVIPAGARAPG